MCIRDRYWETALDDEVDIPEGVAEFARQWQATDKIVISTSLKEVQSARTRIEHSLDPEMIKALKAESDRDVTIDGPTIAGHAIHSGLVDEIQVFIVPAIVGGGNRFYPTGIHLDLELKDERRFNNGVVFLEYKVI